jgi:lysophospholipase L1-like esterase
VSRGNIRLPHGRGSEGLLLSRDRKGMGLGFFPTLLRTLAAILAVAIFAPPAHAVAKKPAAKSAAKKKTSRKRRASRVPIVHVSPKVRQAAFQAVSTRAVQPAVAIAGAAALVPFFEQISHSQTVGPVHILQYGDSHTASDDWADSMRQALQNKFGVGGPGFALAGHPFAGYRRFDIHGASSHGWYTEGLLGHSGDGMYGLAGVSISTASAGETVSVSSDCEQIKLHYLQQPGGGQIEFAVDGVALETVNTDGELAPGIYQYTSSGGVHDYAVRTLNDAPVRLFGWVAQNRLGVTYETLGINGAQASLMLDWNESILGGEMAERQPALIVVAYGTNEALSAKWNEPDYRASFSRVLQRLRAAAPLASILVVGPPDCEKRSRGRRAPFPHLNGVIEIQRQAALENGCAFWDWRGRMGGPGSVRQWVEAGLGQGDYTHLTSAGYRLVGNMLFDELMTLYNHFLSVRGEALDGQ